MPLRSLPRAIPLVPVAAAACVALALAACGSAPPPPPENVVVPVASVSSAPLTPSADDNGTSRHTAPDALLRYWGFEEPPRVALYADLGGFLRTELGRGIVPAALGAVQGMITDAQSQCLGRAAASIQDVAVGANNDALVIARFDDTAFDLAPCMTALGALPVEVAGVHAFRLGGTIFAHPQGVLVAGREEDVTRALGPRTGPSTFPRALTLGPDEYLVFAAKVDENGARGTLLESSERFRLNVEADVPTFIAQQAEEQLRALRGQKTVPGLDGDAGILAARLLQSVELKRDGSHLKATFDLHEPPADQARDLGAVAALGVAGARKYLTSMKSAEARNSINQIGKDYASWWEKEENPSPGHPLMRKTRLLSFPPVPKSVPRGVKYQSTPADWKPWDVLKFELDAPQAYQYEVRASKDGQSADIVARGDLDGNGKQSEFRLHLAINRTTHALDIAPQPEERDPDE